MLEIQTWGGWGDVLRELSLLPVSAIYRCMSLQTRVRHLPMKACRFHEKAAAPDPEAVRDLMERIPALSWAGIGVSAGYVKPLNRGCRSILERIPGQNRLFPLDFHWRPEDGLPHNFDSSATNLVLQTHLCGLPTKAWPVTAWKETIHGLRRKFPSLAMHILDPQGHLLAMEGVAVHNSLTFPQALRLVASSSFLVAVDSWSKYVAAWHRIPQLAIVADQSADYPQVTASTIWRYSFRGLHHCPGLRLLGLQPSGPRHAQYTFGPMARLRSEDLIGKVTQSISPLLR